MVSPSENAVVDDPWVLRYCEIPTLDAVLGYSETSHAAPGLISGLDVEQMLRYDATTYHHSVRMSLLVYRLALALGLDDASCRTLVTASQYHDIGKLQIPLHVLNKPGRLSDSEAALVRRHSEFGADIILKHDPTLVDVADAIASHHEQFDGGGYPLGVSGEDIPFFGRVLAVVDVFDALANPRPYRDTHMTVNSACEFVSQFSGFMFDPNIVGPFVSLLRPYL